MPTEEGYNGSYTGKQIDAAVGAVVAKGTAWDNKQDKVSGKQGQIVGFDQKGNMTAQNPVLGVTIQTGSYVGNGGYGAGSPCAIATASQAKMVIIMGPSGNTYTILLGELRRTGMGTAHVPQRRAGHYRDMERGFCQLVRRVGGSTDECKRERVQLSPVSVTSKHRNSASRANGGQHMEGAYHYADPKWKVCIPQLAERRAARLERGGAECHLSVTAGG